MTLDEVEGYVTENKHLPGIPSTAEVLENGTDVGDQQVRLLQKIEELTLYLIEQNKQIKEQANKISSLESSLKRMSINRNR